MIPNVAGTGKNVGNICSNVQYFANKKERRGGNHYWGGGTGRTRCG